MAQARGARDWEQTGATRASSESEDRLAVDDGPLEAGDGFDALWVLRTNTDSENGAVAVCYKKSLDGAFSERSSRSGRPGPFTILVMRPSVVISSVAF